MRGGDGERSALPRTVRLALWGLVAAFIAAQALTAGLLIEAGRRDAVREARTTLATFAGNTEATLNNTLLGVDVVLQDMAEILRPSYGEGQGFDRGKAMALLVALRKRHRPISELALYTPRGDFLIGSAERAGQFGPQLTPELLTQLSGQLVPSLVAAPMRAVEPGAERLLYLVRPTTLPDGQAALALAEVPLAALSGLFGIGLDGLHATLELENGTLLTSQPRDDAQVGRHLGWAGGALQKSQESVHEGTDRLRGEPALTVVRRTITGSLVFSGSQPMTAALHGWRQTRSATLGAATAFMLLTLVIGGAAHWHLARERRTRQSLERWQYMLDRALDSMGDGFILCDAHDRVLRWNERYEQMFPGLKPHLRRGVPFSELALHAARDANPGADERSLQEWVARRLRAHREPGREYGQRLANGIYVHTVESRTVDGSVVGVYRDVTEAERRLAEAKMAAEAASAAKSQFLASMSHEIRTPLNAVLGMNGLLLGTSLTAKQREYVELMRSSGQMLLSLINDILDVSKIEAGHLKLEVAPFAPESSLREVIALLGVRAQGKGLSLQLEVAPGLPRLLSGDVGRLRQVLFNLIGNALKFTEEGGVVVRVGARVLDSQRVALEVAVQDSGIGIPAELLPRIFERFTQADSTTARRYGGSGLGLAISRELVELMGGRIEARSLPGRGSVFEFSVPLDRADAMDLELDLGSAVAADEAPSRLELAEQTTPGLVPRIADESLRARVLVAEDNAVNQVLIKALLDRMGHYCDTVANGIEAVQQVRAARYDLVLMDVQMPELDGLAATREIRRLEHEGGLPRLPIVAMTANVMPEDREACLDAGMDDHLAKPVEVAALAAAIHAALDAAAAARADAAAPEAFTPGAGPR